MPWNPLIRSHHRSFVRSLRAGGLVAAGALVLGGCVAQNEYDSLDGTARALTDRNAQLARENEQLRTGAEAQQRRISEGDRRLAELSETNRQLQEQLSRMRGDLASFEGRLSSINFGPVDARTDRALRDLANRYPQLVVYDADRGMLRFTSDLTFASGSDQVSDSAKQTLQALAGVLTGSASGYHLRIVGHTDAQRISANTARRHPTNVHLSAHRAISVRDVLVGMGVQPDRVEVAGRGEFDPIVPNNMPRGDTPRNRRVEIYLVDALPGSGATAGGFDSGGSSQGAISVGGVNDDDPMK